VLEFVNTSLEVVYMSINAKAKFNLHSIHNKKVFLFITFITIVILFSSCFVLAFNPVSSVKLESPDAKSEVSDKNVSNEMDLREIVNNVMEPTIITLDNDITLTNSALVIPAGKNITLTSNNGNGFFKLIGANNAETIIVEENCVLILAGIIVTHASGTYGEGVAIRPGGTLMMFDGGICNNTAGFGTIPDTDMTFMKAGGGVFNAGSFSMFGGEISGNTARDGGGVYNNHANFSMFGGKIFGNTAKDGGGVYNFRGNFNLYDGTIYGNTADEQGGGVYSYTAGSGNGILSGSTGSFNAKSGAIYGNTVTNKNGNPDVYNWTTW